MSIRSVNCPKCGTAANIPAAMTNVRCSSCGTVWNVNQPTAATPASSPSRTSSEDDSGGSASQHQLALFAGVGSVLALLAIAGIAIAFFVGVPEEPAPEPVVQKPVQPVAVVEEPPVEVEPNYREVKLPESTRKLIYREYRMLVSSSTEKKIPVMKGSPVERTLSHTLGKTVDREITHWALIHNITEDDVMQIVAEGDAKRWPGSRKPDPPPESK